MKLPIKSIAAFLFAVFTTVALSACTVFPRENHPAWLVEVEDKLMSIGSGVGEAATDVGQDIKVAAVDAGNKVDNGIDVAGESIQKTGETIKGAGVNAVQYVKNIDLKGGQVCGGENTSTLVPDVWGDADFRSACRRHDRCYDRCGMTRKACDDRFRRDLERACKRAYWEGGKSRKKSLCLVAAEEYHFLTSSFGKSAYDTAQIPCTQVERRP